MLQGYDCGSAEYVNYTVSAGASATCVTGSEIYYNGTF